MRDDPAADDVVWDEAATWWVDAVRDDPASSTDFLMLLTELVAIDAAGETDSFPTLDVGCGEGQAMRALGGPTIGTDVSMRLLSLAGRAGPVVLARLPDIGWARTAAFGRCVCVGVLELVADQRALFDELHRVTRPSGSLIVVTNHPVMTAPDAEPLVDPTGEVLWRWGRYLHAGRVSQRLGDHEVTLHHRPIGELLTAAADAGWRLERLIEHGPTAATLSRHPDFRGQEGVPTLLGLRWTR